ASLACWWSDTAVAAVGTLVPGPEAARLFELAGVRTVICAETAPSLPADSLRVITVDAEGRLPNAPEPELPADLESVDLPSPESTAAVFFTSGTTGTAKGITYTHEDCVTAARRIAGGYARNTSYRPDPAPAHLAPGVVLNAFGHTAGYVRLAFRMW